LSGSSTNEILCEVRGGVGLITLNRPAVLNALSHTMVRELTTQLRAWAADSTIHAVLVQGAGEKAFCAGGDIRALYDSYRSGASLHRDFFIEEYRLDYFIHRYPKPYIALLNGIVMGGGMGIAQGARIRIATDRIRLAMPEVGIGFFPDVGASYFLSRLPGALGAYLGLTGVPLRAADAVYSGLADCYLAPDSVVQLPAILAESIPAQDVGTAVRSLATPLTDSPLAKLKEPIDRHFSQRDVPTILKSLREEQNGNYADWAKQTLDTLNSRSPLELAVTLRMLERGRHLQLADCFRMELVMARYAFDGGNMIEGIRALIVDKDNAPRWNPRRFDDVTEAKIEAYFRSPWTTTGHPLATFER
jgi:enoyl-CoA hydratase/carnithine racemase